MHRFRDCLDQRRGIGVEIEWNSANDLAALDDGIESAPVGVVWDKLAVHRALFPSHAEGCLNGETEWWPRTVGPHGPQKVAIHQSAVTYLRWSAVAGDG